MDRRDILKSFIAGAALLVTSLLPYGVARLMAPAIAKPKRNYMRPPGALKDDLGFQANCIGCGLCGEVCPVKCINFHRRDGGAQTNLPFINPQDRGCILCGKCQEVCPTKALSKVPREDVDLGIAQLDRTACYPWVDRGVCGACVSVCPLGDKAIGYKMWNQYRPVVHDACVGCGMCVEVCPHPSKAIWIVDRAQGTIAKHKV